MELRARMEAGAAELGRAQYVGRGLVLGVTPSGRAGVQVYWVSGRSASSRNRVLVQEGDCIRTQLGRGPAPENAALLVYCAMRPVGASHIVSNGDHTDVIAESLARGGSFETALDQVTAEPDAPISTPRIAGLTTVSGARAELKLAVVKTVEAGLDASLHSYFTYRGVPAGAGFCVHTYAGEETPSSFTGEPRPVPVFDSLEENAQRYWQLLDPAYRVSLVVKHIELASGRTATHIINGDA